MPQTASASEQANFERIRAEAQRWLDADPDPVTSAELQELLTGDLSALQQRFDTRLSFGTAGIRGAMGAGPARMNRVLVRIVAAALAERVLRVSSEDGDDGVDDGGGGVDAPMVVIGYDARHNSRLFAQDTARVLAGRKIAVKMLSEPLPTPVLAFAVKHLDAAAAVMVTASHNPRTDNGYKIYWRGGSLLTAPVDAEISEIIDRTPPLSETDLVCASDPLITTVDDEIVEAYLDTVTGLLTKGGARSLNIAYTPLHGVGAATFCRALLKAGFAAPDVVTEQALPDPDFATTAFPNPEEAGVVDRLLQLAADRRADLAVAHDPDADRLAVAVPDGERWRLLTGDETGCLLAEHLLSRSGAATTKPTANQSTALAADFSNSDAATAELHQQRLVINTVVSSRLLSAVAAHHDADWVETLTGFKWIMQAAAQRPGHELVLGYEDALGYVVGQAVYDKDGIGAALVMAELVAELKAKGRTLVDLLDDLHCRHGAHATGQRSIRFEPSAAAGRPIAQAMQQLRACPPAELAGVEVTAVHDFVDGSGHLPPADLMAFEFRDGAARVLVRPSGTEPKIKVYGEAVVMSMSDGPDGTSATLGSAQAVAHAEMTGLVDAIVRCVADFERRPDKPAASLSSAAVAPTASLPAAATATALTAEAADMSTFHTSDLMSPSKLAQLTEAPDLSLDDLRLVVRCTDLTTLEGNDTPGRIRALCAEALRPDPADPTVGPVAAVCVYPTFVSLAAELLAGTPVAVASVAGAFPSGLSPLEVKIAEVKAAVAAGAQEIDTVLNRGAFLSGDPETTAAELRALREAAGEAHFKVILEVCELGSTNAITEASQLAIDAGATMLKTSTGKGASGASVEAVTAMAEAIAAHCAAGGRPVGIKIAGGVRSAAEAVGYVNVVRSVLGPQWLNPQLLRFGASSLLRDVIDTLNNKA